MKYLKVFSDWGPDNGCGPDFLDTFEVPSFVDNETIEALWELYKSTTQSGTWKDFYNFMKVHFETEPLPAEEITLRIS